MSFALRQHKPWHVCLVFICFTLLFFGFYYSRTLQGDINNHILAGEMFGVPAELKARGLEPLYRGPGQTGWDGQFYYYMANDILGVKDTPQHIDSAAYRYQRIGLSLYTAITAKLLWRDWVSPAWFFWSYVCLVVAAVWAGAKLFQQAGASPCLILLWALGVGPQITMFNALPDAAADAFLIMGLFALHRTRLFFAAAMFCLAGLSREVYVLFPAFILASRGWAVLTDPQVAPAGLLSRAKQLCRWHAWYWLALPGLAVVGWRLYVVRHFGVSPGDQADGILGLPLQAWLQYFISGVQGRHLLVPASQSGWEALCLLLFLLVLLLAAMTAITMLARQFRSMSVDVRGVAAATLCFAGLYACFGPVVIMHYTGYFKAVAVFFFLIPFLRIQGGVSRRGRGIGAFGFLGMAVVLSMGYNLGTRILVKSDDIDRYTRNSWVTNKQAVPCFTEHAAQWHVRQVRAKEWDWFARLFGRRGVLIVDLDLTNTSHVPWVSSQAPGGVNMSYQWVDRQGKAVTDGVRTALVEPLLPGRTVALTLVVRSPAKRGEFTLRLSPVQEQCAWFYRANPALPAGF